MRSSLWVAVLAAIALGYQASGPEQTYLASAMRTDNQTTASSSSSKSKGKRKREDIVSPYEQFARSFLSTLDTNVDPCDDFYKFVCGKTTQANDIVVRQNVDNQIKSMVNSHDPTNENLMRIKRLHASCRLPDPKNYEFLRDLVRSAGGIPLGGQESGWDNDLPFDWIVLTAKLTQLGAGVDQMFKFQVRRAESMFKLSVELPENCYFNELDKTVHRNWIKSLYPRSLDSDIHGQLLGLEEFRKNLCGIIEFPDENMNSNYIESIREMTNDFPTINWLSLFEGLMEQQLAQDHEVVVYHWEKIKLIVELLDRTRPEVLANHMMLMVIEDYAHYVTLPASGAQLHPRFNCERLVELKLGLALSVEYHKHFVTRHMIESTQDIVGSVKSEIKQLIDSAGWILHERTRVAAKAKVDAIEFELAISQRLLDEPERTIEWFYHGLRMTDAMNVIENLMMIEMVKQRFLRSLIGHSSGAYIDWIDYDHHPTTQNNAYYNLAMNRIRIQAGIIDGLFVEGHSSPSVDYGILGTAIGHEIMHAFDSRSVRRDSNRQLVDWWDADSARGYNERLRCLKRQYDGLQVAGANWRVDGKATLVENVADNAGHLATYRALSRRLAGKQTHNEDDDADGLGIILSEEFNLNPRQVFWVAYAHRFCADPHHVASKFYELDTHSPPNVRINTNLQNYDEFGQDFGCPLGANMNPRHKCAVW